MGSKGFFWGKIILGMLTLLEALSVYQALFCAWMTASSPANLDEWRTRFYIRLTTAIVVGILGIGLVIWLVRQKRKSGKPETSSP